MQNFQKPSYSCVASSLSGVLAALLLLPPSLVKAEELSLERVVLSAGGVGYFEYEGQVSGDAVLPVDIRLDQVDDVLKSLVIYDNRGSLGRVTMPGKAPLDVAFRELPFSQQALGSMPDLLTALTGAEVTIYGDQRVTGRIVNVTQQKGVINGSVFNQNRVNLLTENGLVSVVLEQSGAVTFRDAEVQAQIDRALLAIAENRRQDRRQLAVNLFGQGQRDIRLGYVVAAPLWKSSYRLSVVEGDDSGTAQLTGWAILENMSGQDWDEVELVVTSGNPVTFRQALYESYYVDRPAIPVEVLGRVLPSVDGGSVAMDKSVETGQIREEFAARRSRQFASGSMGANSMVMAASPMAAELDQAMPETAMAPAEVIAAESQEAATQVVFRYPEPVTVTSGSSIMLPIIARDVAAEQVALYNPNTHASHPLASVKLTNDGETSLPPGVVTLYATAESAGPANFAGDAQLSPLPAGDSRLLSFALDQQVSVVRDPKFSERKVGGSIIDGILRLNVNQLSETVYKIENTHPRSRTVILEHPKQSGWDLASEIEGVEETNTAYRVPVTVEAESEREITVTLMRPIAQRYELTSIDGSLIATFAAARTLSEELRQVMATLATYKQRVEDQRRVVDGIQNRLDQRSQDQERVRRLLTSVPRDSDLYRRYLSDLNRQEDVVQRLQTERYDAEQIMREAEGELLAYARDLEINP